MPKILIMDDEDGLRQIYARYLGADGFQVLEASDDEKVLQELRDENFDAILLDIRMPMADGPSLIPTLRHYHPHAKIIISSCYDLAVQKKMITNVEGYFNKTEGCRALSLKVKEVLC